MKRLFPHPIYTVILSLGWMILREQYSVGDLAVGFVVAAGVVYVLRDLFLPVRVRAPLQGLRLLLVFAREVLIANVQVAWIVIRPRLRIQPAAIQVPLDLRDDIGITALANMITLTPGTWTIDVAPDRSALYVHCLSAADVEAVKRQIKEQFETPLKETVECSPQ
jgi:multicomponent K+:H+ antiporter subunit E